MYLIFTLGIGVCEGLVAYVEFELFECRLQRRIGDCCRLDRLE
jgi:hypothetical protein